MIRVLVVDDSPVARGLLTEILNGESDIKVVGEAVNGIEGVRLAAELQPDLVTMDVRMPRMDGYAATREIMTAHPVPIIVVSGSTGDGDVEKSLQALAAGALTVIGKPPSPSSPKFEKSARLFLKTVRAMSAVSVIRRHRDKPANNVPATSAPPTPPILPSTNPRLIVIAASTGGPQALRTVLSPLSADFPVPIVVVQHISAGFTPGLASWLQQNLRITVRIAQDKEKLTPGTVYIAPEGFHCSVLADGRTELQDRPPLGGFRPSATVLFESAGRAYRDSLIAVMLTGMGSDGVEGLKSVRQMRGVIISQDEASSVVYGMPKAAIDAGLVDKSIAVDHIGGELLRMLSLEEPKPSASQSPNGLF